MESPQAKPAAAAAATGFDQQSSKPHLRFRQTDHPQSPSEGNAPRLSQVPRRASSVISNFSETSHDRTSRGSYTDDFFSPRARDHDVDENHTDPSWWHSAPLAFALVPAVGGVLFKRGSAVITDIALLAFAAIYLNWTLITPWHWYHSAQAVRLKGVGNTNQQVDDIRLPNGGSADDRDQAIAHEDDEAQDSSAIQDSAPMSHHETAEHELRLHEAFAFALCVAGPLIGAYILHIIRASLSDSADEMVSGLHLTLFVLAAELRPLRHILKMVQSRTVHLQRSLRDDPFSVAKIDDRAVLELTRRMEDTESSLATMRTDKATAADSVVTSTAESVKKSQNVMQSQIDALTRAVRRYEKRALAQSIQNEARLQDLENRLRDALSLAAVAATYSQRPGLTRNLLEGISALIFLPLQATWTAITYPFRMASRTIVRLLIRTGLVHVDRRRRQATPRRQNKTIESKLDRVPASAYKR